MTLALNYSQLEILHRLNRSNNYNQATNLSDNDKENTEGLFYHRIISRFSGQECEQTPDKSP